MNRRMVWFMLWLRGDGFFCFRLRVVVVSEEASKDRPENRR